MSANSTKGFTLVELLVVLFLMGLLATIGLSAVVTVQARARDSERISDISQIKHSLALFYAQYEHYPDNANTCVNPLTGGWNDSYYTGPGIECTPPNQFIYELFSSKVMAQVMIDPQNTSDYTYSYHHYSTTEAIAYGCDKIKPFYILGIRRFEDLRVTPSDSGFSCASRNWQDEFSYVTQEYE